MTLFGRLKTGIIVAFLLLLGSLSTLKAQTTIELINDSDNSVIFRIENLDKEITPNKILLVYDSNLITLESTSTKAQSFQINTNTRTSYSHSSSAAALAYTLAEDIEKEEDIESWMLKPFETIAENRLTPAIDTEDDIDLEPWMTDLKKW